MIAELSLLATGIIVFVESETIDISLFWTP